MQKRTLIKSTWTLFLTGFLWNFQNARAAKRYPKTPSDSEGPYYPVSQQKDEDNNLIQVTGRSKLAEGTVLSFEGVVINSGGQPYKNAEVEIWQNDRQGRYRHPDDSSPGERDPDFQYWGRAKTGDNGHYSFTTLLPQAYSSRPPHIHYKVRIKNRVVLTSKLYFSNHPESDRKPWGSGVELKMMELKKTSTGHFSGTFRIVI